ncbi:hypothetical protein NFI96_034657, partial [Prochilodus magdalenae]
EAAIDTAGPVDDGTESIGDAPSLSEEAAGGSLEVKPCESEGPLETILSEEGQQVCQETSPEFFEEGTASGTATDEADPEICAPVIHHTITSSPPDNDLLGAVPFSLATESSLFLSGEPALEQETFPDVQPTFVIPSKDSIASEHVAEMPSASEPIPEVFPAHEPTAEVFPAHETTAEVFPAHEPTAELTPAPEPSAEVFSAHEPTAEVFPAHEPTAELTPAPEPTAEVFPAHEPTAELTPAPEPTAEVFPAHEPTAEVFPAHKTTAEVFPAHEPTAEVFPAHEPTAELTPAPEPSAEVFSAHEPSAEVFPAHEPTAEVFPAHEPTAEVFPAHEPTAELTPAPEPTAEVFPAHEPTAELTPAPETTAELTPAPETIAEVTPSPEPTDISFSLETPDSSFPNVTEDISAVSISCTSAVPIVDIHAEVSPTPERSSQSLPSEVYFSSVSEGPLVEDLTSETIATSVSEEEESPVHREEPELPNESIDVVREPDTLCPEVSTGHPEEGDGLRLRHVQHAEVQRQSSDEEDEEEEEFKLPERKEEKTGFSLNHLIIGALALLCLGSLFFTGTMVDQAGDFDGSELSDQELLEKLAQENKQISILEGQIQSQKEELDKALKLAADKGITDQENAKMKEELSSLPALKEELEALKARISELTQLTAEEPSETSQSFVRSSPGVPSQDSTGWRDKQEELKRQKTLLEESRKRLEGIKKQSWHKKDLKESLVKIQQRLSEQVDHLGKRDEWKRKHKEHKEGKKEWSEKKRKVEETLGGKEWKLGKDKHDSGSKHKEHFKKYREEWDHKKDERKLERERRQQERPWQTKPDHHHQHRDHHHHHHRQQQPQHELVDFWKHQEEKLRRNQNPPERCRGVADCADAEGLIPVKLSEFQALLEIYLSKLEGVAEENLVTLRRLVAQFFRGGIFSHDSMLFSEFAEDVADILEDLADVLMDKQHGGDDDALEEKMEQFEKEALWKFAASAV